jgi:hypothetical protein
MKRPDALGLVAMFIVAAFILWVAHAVQFWPTFKP